MSFLRFKNVGISAVSACVPKNIEDNLKLDYLIPKKELENTIKTIGIKERRVADDNVCASDLCYYAAEHLFDRLDIDKDSIDVLIFMSQNGDYKIPATAPSLQHRLGFKKTTASFDISLACSGYVYALSTAFAYASLDTVNRVLLLDGETFSKLINTKDKVNAPLYGDAGTATIIEKGNFGESYFSLNSDGSGVDVLKIEAGGGRNKTTHENVDEKDVEDGNIRSPHQLYMDGIEVFNFTMMNIPKDIKNILKKTDLNLEEIDQIVFHQANKFMTDFFVKKLKYPSDKVPYCIQNYGNTSSASIPLTISSEMKKRKRDKVIFSGFGAGLSWGTAILSMSSTEILEVIEK